VTNHGTALRRMKYRIVLKSFDSLGAEMPILKVFQPAWVLKERPSVRLATGKAFEHTISPKSSQAPDPTQGRSSHRFPMNAIR
jgi:hypothetical protein